MPYPYYNPYMYQQPQPMQNTQPQSQPNRWMIWVQGETGAIAYPVAPGETIPLWDSESNTIYLKSVDPQGRPSMTKLPYTNPTAPEQPQYVTRRELEEILTQRFGAPAPQQNSGNSQTFGIFGGTQEGGAQHEQPAV